MPDQPEQPGQERLDRTSTLDGIRDKYDHAISLIDATAPAEASSGTPTRSDSASWTQLPRGVTSTSIKDQFARRKYAKWRQERYDTKPGDLQLTGAQDDGEETINSGESQRKRVGYVEHSDSEAVDFGRRPDSPEETRASAQKQQQQEDEHQKLKSKSKSRPKDSAIDILYENQRGSFFCGIPLYSHSSLLNFDPAPWVTKDYKDSAVDITNAQVPDPSWQWAWKHWYVDMSDDVDEDGWQYSFAFFGNFSWHGTHPWFHSFCRRRRWLRRRVKREHFSAKKPQPSSMSAAHKLNTDYFTIHNKRERSPGQAEAGPRTSQAESFLSYDDDIEPEELPEDLNSIAALLKALRVASIDREKLEYVRNFVESGGEELAYLRGEIPEIMSFLVFQNSRRQLLEFLRQKAREAQEHRDEHNAESRPEGEAESRRINNILKAIEAADEQIHGLEYWSDRKHVLQTTDDTKSYAEKPLATIFDKSDKDPQISSEQDIAGDIRGIGEKAGLGTDPTKQTVYRGARLAPADENDEKKADKGKGKEKEKESEASQKPAPAPRLKTDQVVVPQSDGPPPDATDDFSQLPLE